jgi:hypothetical protein
MIMHKTQMKNRGHLGTALFWIALLALCSQGAAQIPTPPRPPLPIPNVVALMPPVARYLPSQPTPIPPPTPAAIPIPPQRPIIPPPTPEWLRPAMMPVAPLSDIALPPAEYDRAFTGKLNILREDSYAFIQHVCRDTPNAVACSYRTYDSVSGVTISCLIMLGPDVWDDERALRHEMAHCNGWPGDHPGAR